MNKKNIIIGSIIAVLAILLITSFLWNKDVRNKLRIAQHNVEAALDSIRYLKDAMEISMRKRNRSSPLSAN